MESTFITINREGNVLSTDKNLTKMLGYTSQEVVGRPLSDIIPPPYTEQHHTFLHHYLQTGFSKMIEKNRYIEAQRKDLTSFPARLSVSKVGEGEDIIFIIVLDKLQDSTVCITIDEKGSIVACNSNTEELFGWKINELIGENVTVLMEPENRDAHAGQLKRYLEGGPPTVIGRSRNLTAVRKDGTPFPVSIFVEEIKVGDMRFFRGRLDRMDVEASFTLTEDGTILASNEHCVEILFGREKKDLIGSNITLLVPGLKTSASDLSAVPLSDCTLENGQRATKRRKIEKSEEWRSVGAHYFRAVHKDGSSFPIVFETYPLSDIFPGPVSPTICKTSPCKTGHLPNHHQVLPVESIFKYPFCPLNPPRYCITIKRADIPLSTSSCFDKLVGEYSIMRTLGQGTYGKVKMAVHRRTSEKVAIKILVKVNMKNGEIDRIRREIEIMRLLNHPHIAKFLDVIETDEAINIVMEYGGKPLSDITDKGPLSEDFARRIFNQIASAVQYCHHHKVIHRDLKHQNILLDDNNNCKVIDFGLSNYMEEGKWRTTFCGTPAYAAPEIILGKKYVGPGVDIWSLGIVLYSCVSGTMPFDTVADIIGGNMKPFHASEGCVDLVTKILNIDPESRYSIDQVMSHPWCKESYACERSRGSGILAPSPSSEGIDLV